MFAFLKGVLVASAAFVAGFVILSLALPPSPDGAAVVVVEPARVAPADPGPDAGLIAPPAPWAQMGRLLVRVRHTTGNPVAPAPPAAGAAAALSEAPSAPEAEPPALPGPPGVANPVIASPVLALPPVAAGAADAGPMPTDQPAEALRLGAALNPPAAIPAPGADSGGASALASVPAPPLGTTPPGTTPPEALRPEAFPPEAPPSRIEARAAAPVVAPPVGPRSAAPVAVPPEPALAPALAPSLPPSLAPALAPSLGAQDPVLALPAAAQALPAPVPLTSPDPGAPMAAAVPQAPNPGPVADRAPAVPAVVPVAIPLTEAGDTEAGDTEAGDTEAVEAVPDPAGDAVALAPVAAPDPAPHGAAPFAPTATSTASPAASPAANPAAIPAGAVGASPVLPRAAAPVAAGPAVPVAPDRRTTPSLAGPAAGPAVATAAPGADRLAPSAGPGTLILGPEAAPVLPVSGALPDAAAHGGPATEGPVAGDPGSAPPGGSAPRAIRTDRLPQIGAPPGDPSSAPASAQPGTAARPPTAAAASPPSPPGPAAATAPAVRTDRLPQIGVDPDPGARTPGAPDSPGAADPAAPRPRWQRLRAPLAPVPDAPLPQLALILIDPAADPLTEAAILALPGPVTVALPPFAADAPRRALTYAAAGHEVVLTLDSIPALALASDLEVLFAAWVEDYPEALGVIDLPARDARRGRSLAPLLVPILRDLELALIAPEQGLSPLLTGARQGGVAHLGIYRSLDSASGDAAALGRILARVAFEADRLGGLAISARADEPAIRDAVARWMDGPGSGDRAAGARVRTVPAGALLALP